MTLLVKKLYTIEIMGEVCCEVCNEIIHNHIELCPVCKTEYASTNAYYNLLEESDAVIKCEVCESKFKKVAGHWYGTDYPDEENSNEDYYCPQVIRIDEDKVS